jgi:diadenosine tetraphosphatase ApaH/serine/threonine PP2A family protein phosphatase
MAVDPQVAVLVCGHTHVPMDRSLTNVRVVNAGSVWIPFDGDPRACYALISNVAANGCGPTQVDLRRVPYDVEKAVEQLYDRHHPAADIGAYNLRTARSIGSNLIYTPEMRHRLRN